MKDINPFSLDSTILQATCIRYITPIIIIGVLAMQCSFPNSLMIQSRSFLAFVRFVSKGTITFIFLDWRYSFILSSDSSAIQRVTRSFYTNDADFNTNFKANLVFTSIYKVLTEPDALRRALAIMLHKLDINKIANSKRTGISNSNMMHKKKKGGKDILLNVYTTQGATKVQPVLPTPGYTF